jgi:hypothetical protein
MRPKSGSEFSVQLRLSEMVILAALPYLVSTFDIEHAADNAGARTRG